MPEPPPTLEDLLGPSVDEPEEDEALTANERAILGRWNETKPEGAPSISETEALDARKYMEPFGFTFEQALTAYGLFVAGRPGIPPPEQAAGAGATEKAAAWAGMGGWEAAGRRRGIKLPEGAEQLPLVQAIYAATDDPQVRWAMLMGAIGEAV